MDVTCERCGTEYDFDDALVSGRGTTVKCTNCGFQFKVRKPEAAGVSESWVVRTVDGREIVFSALRELQQAIGRATITRDDVLARDGARPRRLGSIAELDPFFAGAAGAPLAVTAPGLGREPLHTPKGLVAPSPGALRVDGADVFPGPSRADSMNPEPEPATVPAKRQPSIPPPLPDRPPATPLPPAARAHLRDVATPLPPPAAPLPPATPPPPRTASTPAPRAPVEQASALVPNRFAGRKSTLIGVGGSEPPPASDGTPAARAPIRTPPTALTPTDVRASLEGRYGSESRSTLDSRASFEDGYGEPRFSSPATSRRAGSRWIAALVLGGVVVLGALTVGRRFLASHATRAPSAAASDERIALLLAHGDQSLLEGDLDAAKEALDKASVLVESDPRVAIGLARLAVVHADTRWLGLRLLPANDPDRAAAKRELELAGQRARKAADRAIQLAPSNPAAVRARLDSLRIEGDLEGARKLVAALAPAASQPESSLALAALDLAEENPSLPAAIERLRGAAAAEQGLGRARALLTYALALSGDAVGAKTELERVAALPRPHPLLSRLRAFVASTDDADAGARSARGKPSDSAASVAPASSRADEPPPSGRGGKRPESGRSGGSWIASERVPDDYVAPAQNLPIDTSDLPGAQPQKRAPAPTTSPTASPTAPPATTIDTSDLPGYKP